MMSNETKLLMARNDPNNPTLEEVCEMMVHDLDVKI